MSPRETAPFRAVALDRIQDFTTWAPILNFVGEMARNKRFSGEFGCEPRWILKITSWLTGGKLSATL